PHRMIVSDLTLSPDGHRLYSVGGRDRSLKRWGMDGTLLHTHKRPNNVFGAFCVAVSPDQQTVAVGWRDHRITLVDSDGTLRETLLGHGDRISSLTFTSDGRTLVSTSWDGTLKLWDVPLAQLRTTLRVGTERVIAGGITGDGHWIVSLTEGGELAVWDCTPM
ncbi:MAG: hypothetical protein AAGF97_03560, partial [Planctomycetota bacterium]